MSRTRLALFVGGAALLLAACSSSPNASNTTTTGAAVTTTSSPSTTTTTAASSTTSTTAAATSTTAAGGALSGTWKGTYSGSFSGTFVLKWTEGASKLTGHITLSTPPSTSSINGTVNGGNIQFGTVGSAAITYKGSVSGNSMSGSYQVAGAGGGSWSATKA